MLSKIIKYKNSKGNFDQCLPVIVPQQQHCISQKSISRNALKVLQRLSDSGYAAYLVGGSVRDLLLGKKPKDFDIVTDARPEQVRQLFRNCRLIGRRFRLAHIYFHNEIIEVATFRKGEENLDIRQLTHSKQGMILRDNIYGGIDDDIWRRDLTINALYCNVTDFSVVDYTTGLADLQQAVIRIIGEPSKRLREDPVRILRVIRFAAKLGFSIESKTAKALEKYSYLLSHVAKSRLFDETLKLLLSQDAVATFAMLRKYKLLTYLLPLTETCLVAEGISQLTSRLIMAAMHNTEQRICMGKKVAPGFIFAILLWEPVLQCSERYRQQGVVSAHAFDKAVRDTLSAQQQFLIMPRFCSHMMIDIWKLQHQFYLRRGKRPFRLLNNRRFRAAYDFLVLRAKVEPKLQYLVEWWTKFQTLDSSAAEKLIKQTQKSEHKNQIGFNE